MTLTKSDIVGSISYNLGFTKRRSVEAIETLLEIMKKSLESGEDVLISGFGKFCVKDKRGRRGRNPATGGDMMLRPQKVVTFKCSGKSNRNRRRKNTYPFESNIGAEINFRSIYKLGCPYNS